MSVQVLNMSLLTHLKRIVDARCFSLLLKDSLKSRHFSSSVHIKHVFVIENSILLV